MVRAKTALGTALLLTPFMGSGASSDSVGAEATWVQDGVDNEVTVSLVNFSDEPIMTNLDLVVQDYTSRNVEWIERIGVLQMAPRAQRDFTFTVRDLPKAGAKKVVAQTGYAGIYGESGKILVVRQQDAKGYAAKGSSYRIAANRVNIRTGPGEKYPKARDPLPFGTPVKLVKTDGTWIKVEVLDAGDSTPPATGWVLGKFVKSPQG
jgi:uncharacterized protein YgiM (DUF1202 family)